MKEYNKIYSVELFKKHIFKIIEDKKNKNYVFIEKYINNILYTKKYNSIDCIYEYLAGIKGALIDAK